jgi:hypothetical protein
MVGVPGEQQQWPSRSWRHFPMVLLVTGTVFVLPILVVWELRSSGAVTSLWLLLLIAIAISQAVSWLLRAYWTHSMHRSDLLFSELLIWGWLWQLRRERQLASAARMLRRLEPVRRRGAAGGPGPRDGWRPRAADPRRAHVPAGRGQRRAGGRADPPGGPRRRDRDLRQPRPRLTERADDVLALAGTKATSRD